MLESTTTDENESSTAKSIRVQPVWECFVMETEFSSRRAKNKVVKHDLGIFRHIIFLFYGVESSTTDPIPNVRSFRGYLVDL